MKKTILLVAVTIIMIGLTVRAYAGYYQPQQRYNQQASHRGLYLGGGLGVEVPTGPDQNGYSAGFGWAIRIGYQFIKNLAVELGYDQGVGSLSDQGVTGSWSFLELPYLDIKPIIPLSLNSDLYFLAGVSYADNSASVTNPSVTFTLGPDIGFDLGIGYEYYITNNWSLGGELIYHHLTSTSASASPGGSVTLPYAVDGSATSVNFAFLYHF